MYEALLQRDYNLLLGVFVVCSAMVLISISSPIWSTAWSIRASTFPHEAVLEADVPQSSGLIGLIILVIPLPRRSRADGFPEFAVRMVQRPFLPPFNTIECSAGTDALGRDVFAGMIYGARVSLLVGPRLDTGGLAIGVPRPIAGYFGGRIDDALMRFTEFSRPFELRPRDRAGGDLQPSIYSIFVASIPSSAGRRWPGWCAARCLSLRSRDMSRPPSSPARPADGIIWHEIPAQRALAGHRAGIADGPTHPAGILAVVPRPRRSQSDFVGLHGRRRPHRDPQAWWITVFRASPS